MYYVVTIFYIKPNTDIVTGEVRVTGLYLRWDLPSPSSVASYELFICAFSNLSDRSYCNFLIINIQVINMNPLSCSTEDAWEHGNSLINYMKMVEIEGLTGRIKFDQDGQRSDFQLEIVELKKHGLDKVLFFPQIIYYLKKKTNL